MKAIEIKNLEKNYGKNTVLDKVSFSIESGDFFALLGHNGAGKTTLISILTNLVNKSSGTVKIGGIDIDKDFQKARTQIGVVPQEFNFDIFSRVIDIPLIQAGYYGIDKETALKRTEKYLKKLGLWEKRDARARELSGGMKRRLMIVRALVHKPKILILDEPTAGVDVELRKSMWEFIQELNDNGTTILLTTHYLEEVESLCKNVAIMHKGKIVEN
ncbi:MAG: ABC transporter ATP-binding protein, partial [Candidatus Gracilibacteria bacterium]|nr:ABC transporter ATP-binding protein [Candidatus Gracilibacteria bacterium]